MALRIRMARGGSKKNAHYKIVVIESTKARDGMATEIIGHYHPMVKNEQRFIIDAKLLDKWISQGALPSETVTRLCVANGIESMNKFIKKHGKSANTGVAKKDRPKKDKK